MAETPRPATGPVILDRVLRLEAQITQLQDDMQLLIRSSEQRNRLLEQFLNPACSLQVMLTQLRDAELKHVQQLQTLTVAVHDEHRTTRSAVALHMGTEELLEREHGA